MAVLKEIMNMAKNNNGIVTTAMVVKAGFSRGNIQYLVDSGKLQKSARGIYLLPDVWDDELFNIQNRFKRGVFSLETALFLWNLTDKTPCVFTMTFPATYNIQKAKNELICVQCKDHLYKIGITHQKSTSGNELTVYN
ncbi:MAG: type IV toxin-antitoxin system AbiEi family antitoxin domain-containing protein, partial [Spirochaetales bacterium]